MKFFWSFLVMVAVAFLLIASYVDNPTDLSAALSGIQGDPSHMVDGGEGPLTMGVEVGVSYPENFPDGALKPEFCALTQITSDDENGKYDLWGTMPLPIMNAGDIVHRFMRNTAWEPDGVIKQADAAALSYTDGKIKLGYTFLLNNNKPNTCLVSWSHVDYNKKMKEKMIREKSNQK